MKYGKERTEMVVASVICNAPDDKKYDNKHISWAIYKKARCSRFFKRADEDHDIFIKFIEPFRKSAIRMTSVRNPEDDSVQWFFKEEKEKRPTTQQTIKPTYQPPQRETKKPHNNEEINML
jgi:hypothetical protein